MDQESAFDATEEFARLVGEPKPDDVDWCESLDRAFLNAAFLYDPQRPFQHGPDGLAYFFSRLPEVGMPVVFARNELDYIVEWVSGWTVLRNDQTVAWVYRPGDMVALKLYGRTRIKWQGGWGKLPDLAEYAAGGQAWEGRPGAEMLPPLAARSLEYGLRSLFASTAKLSDRVPSVKLVRLATHERPEDASDLSINFWPSDLDNDAVRIRSFLDLACCHLPRHLATRVISGSGPGAYTPLRQIVEDAGMQLAPQR